jgi:hypothetical protein
LDDLVAPIALYPDPLLSQILVAATYPLEVVQAYQWLQRNPGLTGPALTQGAQQQNWDASIQALVVFPDVVKQLNDDVTWTTNLGNAFLAQQQDVMHAVERMRLTAQQAGKLQSSPQESVVTTAENGQTIIEIQPADPDVIYVWPEGKDIVESGDPVEDQRARAEFARRANEKMEIEIEPSNRNRAILVVGQQNWPFPVPLIAKNGQWRFDPSEGRLAILARRIGRNELTAIDVCRAYVEAQLEYASRDRIASGVLEYAQTINSSSGKKDGLYREGEPNTLVPKAFADAAITLSQSKGPVPYHGYHFHILKAQGPEAPGGAMDYVVKGKMIGGFALVAFPAEYGVSGVKTFIVNQQGIAYQKDLGPPTSVLARQMTRFNPDKTWKPVIGE